jgi:predicted nuclease with RNAse H fold
VRWLGVDVGAKRKGFDIALIEDRRLVMLAGGLDCDAVLRVVAEQQPEIVGIDSPKSCARAGECARDGERRVNREICGIRWTPDAEHVHGSAYYAWIVEGLSLFERLAARGVAAIEVFPTASWTRWFGRRGPQSRSRWSREGLGELRVAGAPIRTNQDQRDAIAAALTAREHAFGRTEMFGEIVIPTRRP